VGEVWHVDRRLRRQAPSWARSHPHVAADLGPTSFLYVAADGEDGEPDAGVFPTLVDELILTARAETRRHWRLPGWFHPEDRPSALSYHGRAWRWERRGRHVLLTTVGRGQEFVLDAADYPEADDWARNLIAVGASQGRPGSTGRPGLPPEFPRA